MSTTALRSEDGSDESPEADEVEAEWDEEYSVVPDSEVPRGVSYPNLYRFFRSLVIGGDD